jgi:hypothetical protein
MRVLLVGMVFAVAGCGDTWSGSESAVCRDKSPGVVAAVVSDSGSTNAGAATVTVYCEGDAQRDESAGGSLTKASMNFPMGSAAVTTFLADLSAVGNVSALKTGRCAKSVSFGSVTTLTVGKVTTGDIQCLEDPTPAESALVADCFTLLND